MNDLSDICRLLISLYLNIEQAWIIFILPHSERYRTEPVEQFFVDEVGAHLQDRGFIKQRLRSANFQDASLVDDGYAIAERFHVGKLMRIEENAHTLGLQLSEEIAHIPSSRL